MMRGRAFLSVLLVVSVLLTGVVRQLAYQRHTQLIPPVSSASAVNRTNANSFTLALLLGGLRGPLVMFLWISSENQKLERNFEDLDTKIDLIRQLQPEFVSVHLFQIWNKAYNISVLMAGLANKYSTVLEALDYANKVDQQRPDDLNIQIAISTLYFEKLGNSAEKAYYSQRVRTDTLPRAMAQHSDQDAGWRRTRLDPMLDSKGHLLAQLTRPDGRHERPADLPADAEWNDGSALQYLERYDTAEAGGFPYGISPLALGYNYGKRAQVLMARTHQTPINFGDRVVDMRPGLILKFWAEEERERARRLEFQALGVTPFPKERTEQDRPTADKPLTSAIVNPGALDELLFSYDRCAQVCEHSRLEYERHIGGFSASAGVYASHLDELEGTREMALADAAYIRAMTSQGPERSLHAQTARKHYQQAMATYYRILLTHYVDDQLAAAIYPRYTPGPGQPQRQYTRATIGNMDPSQYPKLYEAVKQVLGSRNPQGQPYPDMYSEDRGEYENRVVRAALRLGQLGQQ